MYAIYAIAKNVFRETLRDRVLYVLALFALLCITATGLLSEISMRQEEKMVYDLGLAALSFFSIVITLFIASFLLYKEIDKGTIHFILTKPITRAQFVLGKWLGMCMVSTSIVLGLTGILLAVLLLKGFAVPSGMGVGTFYMLIEVYFISALTLFFASITSPLVTTATTIILVITGHITNAIYLLSIAPRVSEAVGVVTKAIVYVVPNFDLLNVSDQIAHGIPITWSQFGWTIVYFTSYLALILFFACALFRKKNF